MKLKFTKLILILIVTATVSACSQINDNSPDKMLRAGVQRMILTDNRLNFSGSYKVEYQIDSNTSDENKNSTESAEIDKTNEKNEKFLNTASKTLPQTQIEDDEDEPQLKNSIGPFWKQLSQSFSVPFTGAIDIRKGQMEIIPEVRYEHKNALVSLKFPTYIDFKNLSLYTDASAVTHLLDTLPNTPMIIGDKYLQLAIPKSKIKDLPLSDLLKSLPKSIDDGYAAIDPNAFEKVNVDEYGKNLKAMYQVNLNLDNASIKKFDDATLESLSKALKEVAAKADQNSKYKPEDYALLQKIVDEFITLNFDNDDSDDNNYDDLEDFKNTEIGMYFRNMKKLKQLTKNLSGQYNYYFDSKGRIIGFRYQRSYPKDIESTLDGKIKLDGKVRLEYTTIPKFTIQPPTPQNSIDIKPLLDKIN